MGIVQCSSLVGYLLLFLKVGLIISWFMLVCIYSCFYQSKPLCLEPVQAPSLSLHRDSNASRYKPQTFPHGLTMYLKLLFDSHQLPGFLLTSPCLLQILTLRTVSLHSSSNLACCCPGSCKKFDLVHLIWHVTCNVLPQAWFSLCILACPIIWCHSVYFTFTHYRFSRDNN